MSVGHKQTQSEDKPYPDAQYGSLLYWDQARIQHQRDGLRLQLENKPTDAHKIGDKS